MRTLLYIIILFVITACSYSGTGISHSLDDAETMLTRDPVKALERLNRYDVSEFQDSATMARWALLYSEALVANRLVAPTDTIIDIAIDYYGSHNIAVEYRHAQQLKAQLSVNENSDALATALYIQKEKEFMLYKEKTRRTQLLFITLIAITVATGIITWQRQRLKLKSAQNESLIAEASSLRDGLILRQSECSDLNVRLSVSLANRFRLIDELCETYYESQGTRIEKKAIADKVKSQIDALRSDSGIFSEMERCHEDLLQKFREEIPDFKPEEYRMMVYLASGLSNRTMALLIGESINVAYKRKSRLKAKIAESGTPSKALFLSHF